MLTAGSSAVAIARERRIPLFIKLIRNSRAAMTSFDHNTRLHSFQLLAKRGFDIVVSATGLIVLSPLFLLTSLTIKLESRGPIFSVRYEYCYDDQKVRTIRFRTAGYLFYRTPTGHLLSDTGLERLPMLINVLRGGMSIIGPRCHVVLLSAPLAKELARALTDSPLKPGLINPDGQVDSALRQIGADLSYVSNWSLLLDAKILFGSLFSKGAYI